ncbi:unnamed protein product [Soboliphyme baturini]|uniref:GIY-YIG domain-containing protein n=1 Tax=Soboliphyme baturini TaxID=241478 RepID=A0A183IQ60_9BILA|nr:unnamed protein product [Soboliphyme baturini]
MIADLLKNVQHASPQIREAQLRLERKLLNITELYQDYAEVFNLPECKLAILHCGGHYDANLIELTWREIVDKEMALIKTKPAEIQAKLLLTKLSLTLQRCALSERYIPIEYLLKTLFSIALSFRFPFDWISQVADVFGASQDSLLDILNHGYTSGDLTEYHAAEAEIYLMENVLAIMKRFLDNMAIVPPTERSKFCTVCLDTVSLYTVELYGKPSNPSNLALIQEFELIETKLERVSRRSPDNNIHISLPYVRRLSEKLRRIGSASGLNVVFKTGATLRSRLSYLKTQKPKEQEAGWVYQLPCICGAVYIGETGSTVEEKKTDHMRNLTRDRRQTKDPWVVKAECEKNSAIVEHTHQHNISLDRMKGVAREQQYLSLKVKEALLIQATKCINRDPWTDVGGTRTENIKR